MLNKLLPLVTFFILLLVPIGAQNAFALHTDPFLGIDGHCDLTLNPPVLGVDYSNCNLSGVVLADLNLSGADFSGADLTNADLSGANLVSADFVDANLSGANLSGADLSDADFSGANLSGAILNCLNHSICDALVGGYLIDIDNASLFVAAIGTNPVLTGLVGITLAGVAVQAVWFVHRRKNSENS